MSVQVSYKKQTLLGIIGLVILFLVIELIYNLVKTMDCLIEKSIKKPEKIF